MEKIIFVCGESGTGKSTYIYNKFKNKDYILFDIYTYQNPKAFPIKLDPHSQIYISQSLFESDLFNNLKDIDKDYLVIEGTFLKKSRRMSIIQTIRNVSDIDIECVFLKKRDLTIIDIPDISEGFSKIEILSKDKINYSEKEIFEANEYNEKRRKEDTITSKDLLGYQFIKNRLNVNNQEFERLFNNHLDLCWLT